MDDQFKKLSTPAKRRLLEFNEEQEAPFKRIEFKTEVGVISQRITEISSQVDEIKKSKNTVEKLEEQRTKLAHDLNIMEKKVQDQMRHQKGFIKREFERIYKFMMKAAPEVGHAVTKRPRWHYATNRSQSETTSVTDSCEFCETGNGNCSLHDSLWEE